MPAHARSMLRSPTFFAAVWASVILVGTLWPLPRPNHGATLATHATQASEATEARTAGTEAGEPEPAPLVRLDLSTADFVRNWLLFMPLGALLIDRRLRSVLLGTGALSLAIEITQLFVPGRYTAVADLVANVGGAWMGYAAASVVRATGLRDARLQRFAYLGWCAIVVGLLGLAAVGARPALPPPPYFAHWVPDLGHLETYRGALASARLDGADLPHGGIRADRVRETLTGDHTLVVGGTVGPDPRATSALFLITDADRREIAMLALRGDDLLYRVRTRAMELLLERPTIWWHDAFASLEPGSHFEIVARRTGPAICLALVATPGPEAMRHAGEKSSDASVGPGTASDVPTERCDLGPRLEDGWQPWIGPPPLSPTARRTIGLAWIALLFVPLGAGFRRAAPEVLGLGAVLATVAASPRIGPIASPDAMLAVTIAASLVVGWALARVARRGG